MRLAVMGDIEHYRDADGRLCALEPIAVQIDQWASLFDEVEICSPLLDGPPPPGHAPYRSSHISVKPLSKAGGNTRWAKVKLLPHVVPWYLTTRRSARRADVVLIRCPCNVGLVALWSTRGLGIRRCGAYAGAWRSYTGEPSSFARQRELLGSSSFDGPVIVYSGPDPDRPHLQPFFSASYTAADAAQARAVADAKVEGLRQRRASDPLRLVTVGRLSPNKNQQVVLRAVAVLVAQGSEVHLDVVGDGAEAAALKDLATQLGVADRVRFHGWVPHRRVMELLAAADVNLLSTRQEGFGKVLIEGMLLGTVPVFSESPLAGDISGAGRRAVVVHADDPAQFASAVAELAANPADWAEMAAEGAEYAAGLTLETYGERVRSMLERWWGLDLRRPTAAGSS